MAILGVDFGGGACVCGIRCPVVGAALVHPSNILRFDLLHATLVAPSLKFSVQPALHGLDRLIIRHEPGRKDQNVGVVVLARQLSDRRRPGQRGADSGIPIGDDVHADTAATEQDSALGLSLRNFLGERMRVVGIVVGFAWIVRPDVIGRVAQLFQLGNETILHLDSGMIRSDWNSLAHFASASRSSARRSAASYVGICFASAMSNTLRMVSYMSSALSSAR